MDRDQIKEYILSNPQEYLQPDKTGKGYVCPLCGNGTGESGTGLRSKDNGRHFKCFKCGFYGDLIELIARENGLSNGGTAEAFDLARKAFNITVGDTQRTHNVRNTVNTDTTEKRGVGVVDQNEKVLEYIRSCMANLNESQYLPKVRGISNDTAARLHIGYDTNKRAIIIPTQNTEAVSYIERYTDALQNGTRYLNRGKVGLFNMAALTENKPVFIVEGAMDALSIIEVGGSAVAVNSTANTGLLISTIKQLQADHRKLAPMFYIAMDNDQAGKTAAGTLGDGLRELGVSFKVVDICGAHKDANEIFTKNREIFGEVVQQYIKGTRVASQVSPVEDYLPDFVNGIRDSVNTPAVPTGFRKLDDALGGGLFEGLYVVGAISSLGKTTLVMQIADQIAQSGQDVLIFSLEMARAELMAKSISRHTMLEVLAQKLDTSNAKTQLGITDFNRYKNYSNTEKAVIGKSIENYQAYSSRLYIYEGIGNIGVDQVRQTVQNHIFFTGNTPVVIIDYLQILAPTDPRSTDKQNTDKAVLELKRLSRDYKIPVLAISSFNREAYSGAVTMASFKESGAIEYSSDVLIGLQFEGIKFSKDGQKNLDHKQVEELYQADPRRIELKILKNRKGRINDSVLYNYYPKFNLYAER